MSHILSSLIFIPLLAAGLLLFIPARFEKGIKITALLASLALLVLSVLVYVQFQASPDPAMYKPSIPNSIVPKAVAR